MPTSISNDNDLDLLHLWRRQIAGQRLHRAARGPRPLAAISYLTHGPVRDGLIDVRQLVLVTMYDQQRTDGEPPTIRMAGFGAAPVPWGVRFGGPTLSQFDKDLQLAPAMSGQGRRFDLADDKLLQLALNLDAQLERHCRYPYLPRRRQPPLPKLWAAFFPKDAVQLFGDRPEWLAQRHQNQDLGTFRRNHLGLAIYPMEFVSYAWQRFVVVYAELRGFPQRQVLSVTDPAIDLCGCVGATSTTFSIRGLAYVAELDHATVPEEAAFA